MTAIRIDDRYRGAHGIGRYAREVSGRLRVETQPLGLDGSPHAPWDALRALPTLGREDVVYSPGYGALLRAPKQILTLHDLIQLRAPWPERAKFVAYYSAAVRPVVRRAGVVLTVSETSADDLRAWLGDGIEVVNAGNGCSEAFRVEGPVTAAADPYVLFVGNTRRHKNLDVVLRALVLAPQARVRAVVPVGEIAGAVQRAQDLGVQDRIEWLHGVDDEQLAALYRGAAATVMPSLDEGFGLPALESIACGVPVIFWRGCASVGEIVGERGRAVDAARDPEEWALAIEEALADRRRVEPPVGVHDWERTAGIVSDVLEHAR